MIETHDNFPIIIFNLKLRIFSDINVYACLHSIWFSWLFKRRKKSVHC